MIRDSDVASDLFSSEQVGMEETRYLLKKSFLREEIVRDGLSPAGI